MASHHKYDHFLRQATQTLWQSETALV